MKSLPGHRRLLLSLSVLAAVASPAFARVDSDIGPPEKRKPVVEQAVALARESKTAALPPNINLPFAPVNFDLTDAEEAAAAAAAARLANPSAAVVVPPSDHEIFEAIASKVQPSGTIYVNDKPLLMFGKRYVKTGAKFTVTYKGMDYVLELTQIDGTNFTLRYKNEEITRPIKPSGKSQ